MNAESIVIRQNSCSSWIRGFFLWFMVCGAGVVVGQLQQNGFISVNVNGNAITSLRVDATGNGNYGEEIVTGAGIRPFADITLNGNSISLRPVSISTAWDVPFQRVGYYDSDTHLNYPNDRNVLGATPLTLPIRAFVCSSGNTARIEHFKRLPLGNYFLFLNLNGGSSLLAQGDLSQNWDLELHYPGVTRLTYSIADTKLTLQSGALTGNMTIKVIPAGVRDVPSDLFKMPKALLEPDRAVEFLPTGKTVPISRLLSEFMQMGIYWSPTTPPGGEWVIGSEIHLFDDPRSWYLKQVRNDLIRDTKWMGYDRFGHMGYQFAWHQYPDYGAGGLINVPPGNAPNDLRHLHINGIRIQAIVNYVLATRDIGILKARRTRQVSTDGADPQPICGNNADQLDYVLSAGDVRLDPNPATTKHTLGQEFTTSAPFTTARALLGNPSTTEANHGKLKLFSSYGGTLLGEASFSISPNVSQQVSVSAAVQLPPDKYYLEVSDDDSGVRYFGPGVVWWTEAEGNYLHGDAYSGPFKGNLQDSLIVLFNYFRDYMGAAGNDLIFYQNDPQYNKPQDKSGRGGACMPNSYYEGAGGAYDAYAGIWYSASCAALADLFAFLDDPAQESLYRNYQTAANYQYRQKYWHTVTENGKTFHRFYACQDWDGNVHDYGHTYNNLEAAWRRITTPEMSRDLIWWMDRGQWTANNSVWNDDLYAMWEAAAPWNSINNITWLNITGGLPYGHVLTNGGARLDSSARDLMTRAQDVSVDNMHERNERILSRFASPDRLTGGRTFNDPGGRGRWFFLGPDSDRGDFEGFREIFPGNGAVASYQPAAYLGLKHTPLGLHFRPRVPSDLNSLRFNNVGFWNALFNLKATARRTTVSQQLVDTYAYMAPLSGSIGQTFMVSSPFNKVGINVMIVPFTKKTNNQLTLILEAETSSGWTEKGRNWYSNVRNGQWVWVSVDNMLTAGKYRIRATDMRSAAGETIFVRYSTINSYAEGDAFLLNALGAINGDLAFQAVCERTELTIDCTYNPDGFPFNLEADRSNVSTISQANGDTQYNVILDPDESAYLGEKKATSHILAWPLYDGKKN